MNKKPLEFRRNNQQNNADLLLSVYELTARSSLQIQQRPRHQSQSREKYQFKKNPLFDKSDIKSENAQLASISSPSSTKKLPLYLKKMPSPRESSMIANFIKIANEAIENNTDERVIKLYIQLRNQIESRLESFEAAENTIIQAKPQDSDQVRKLEQQILQVQNQNAQMGQQIQQLEKKTESRKVCIKKLYSILETKERELELYKTGKKSCKTSFNNGDKKAELNEILNTAYPSKNKENISTDLINFIKDFDPKIYDAIQQLTTTNADNDAKEAEKNTLIQQALKNMRQHQKQFDESVRYSAEICEKNQDLWKRFLEIDLTCQKSIQNLRQGTLELENQIKLYGQFLKSNSHSLTTKFMEAYQFQGIIGDSIVKWLKQLKEIQELINQRENDQYEFHQFQDTLMQRLKEIMQNNKINLKNGDIKGMLEAINEKMLQQQEELNQIKNETQENKKVIKIEEYLQNKLRNESQQYESQIKQLKDQLEQSSQYSKEQQNKYDQLQNDYNKQTQVSLSALHNKQQEISQLFEQTKRLKEDITKSQDLRLTHNEQRDQISQLKKEVERQNHVIIQMQQLISQYESTIDNNQAEITRLHAVILDLHNQNQLNESAIRQSKDQEVKSIEEIIDKNNQLSQQITTLQEEYAALDDEYKQNQQQNIQFYQQQQLDQEQIQQITAKIEKIIQSNNEQLSKQKQEYEDKINKNQNKMNELQDQIAYLNKELQEQQVSNQQLKVLCESHKANIANLKQQNDSLKLMNEGMANQLNEQESQKHELEQQIIQFNSEIKQISDETNQTIKLNQSLQQEINSLSEQQKNLQNQNQNLQNDYSNTQQKLTNELSKSSLKEQVINDLQDVINTQKDVQEDSLKELNLAKQRLQILETQNKENSEQVNRFKKQLLEAQNSLTENQELLQQNKSHFEQHDLDYSILTKKYEQQLGQVKELIKQQQEKDLRIQSQEEKLKEISEQTIQLQEYIDKNQEINQNYELQINELSLLNQNQAQTIDCQNAELNEKKLKLTQLEFDLHEQSTKSQTIKIEFKNQLLQKDSQIEQLLNEFKSKEISINQIVQNQQQNIENLTNQLNREEQQCQHQIDLNQSNLAKIENLEKTNQSLQMNLSSKQKIEMEQSQMIIQLNNQNKSYKQEIELLNDQYQQEQQIIDQMNIQLQQAKEIQKQQISHHQQEMDLHKLQQKNIEIQFEGLLQIVQYIAIEFNIDNIDLESIKIAIEQIKAQCEQLFNKAQYFEELINNAYNQVIGQDCDEAEIQLQIIISQCQQQQEDYQKTTENQNKLIESQQEQIQQLQDQNNQYKQQQDRNNSEQQSQTLSVQLELQQTKQQIIQLLQQNKKYQDEQLNFEQQIKNIQLEHRSSLDNFEELNKQLQQEIKVISVKNDELLQSNEKYHTQIQVLQTETKTNQEQLIVQHKTQLIEMQNQANQLKNEEQQKMIVFNELKKEMGIQISKLDEQITTLQNELNTKIQENVILQNQMQEITSENQENIQCKQQLEQQLKEQINQIKDLQQRLNEQEEQQIKLVKEQEEQLNHYELDSQQKQNILQNIESELNSSQYVQKIKELKQVEQEFKKQQQNNSTSNSEIKSIEAYCQQLDSLLQEFLYNRVNLTIQSMKSLLTEGQRQSMNEYRKKIGELQNKILQSEKNFKLMEDAKFNLQQYQQIVDKSEQKALYFESECKKKDGQIQELLCKKDLAKSQLEIEEEEYSEQSLKFLDFSMRQEILYGDQSFFEEISYVEQDPPLVIDLHNHCKGHIFLLMERCQQLEERMKMQEEDHRA